MESGRATSGSMDGLLVEVGVDVAKESCCLFWIIQLVQAVGPAHLVHQIHHPGKEVCIDRVGPKSS